MSDFINWTNKQNIIKWKSKWVNKYTNAKNEGLICELTFDEYMFKAFEAGLESHEQIGIKSEQYNLARVNDIGNYRLDNCRFITSIDNQKEKDQSSVIGHTWASGINNIKAKLTVEQVISIWYDTRELDIISKDYPFVQIQAIRDIKQRKYWKNVTDNLDNKEINNGNT